jgi:hypothetical protein
LKLERINSAKKQRHHDMRYDGDTWLWH